MAGKAAFVVTGIGKIDRKLRKLPAVVGKKVVRKSMRAGMKVIKSAVESEVPVDTGLTRSAVKLKAHKRSRNKIGIDVRIDASTEGLKKTSSKGKTVFYPAIVEYGRKKGKKPLPPNPFMRRAFTAKGETARQITLKQLRDGIEEEAGKL